MAVNRATRTQGPHISISQHLSSVSRLVEKLFDSTIGTVFANIPVMSSTRIVPKNLLISAQSALDESTIHANSVRKSNFLDLCSLISLSILYDKVETLGNRDELDSNKKRDIAHEYESLREFTGLDMEVGPHPSDFEIVLNRSVPFAISPFLDIGKGIDSNEIKMKLTESLRNGISDHPDRWEEFAEGKKLLNKDSLKDDSTEPENFWLRSFLYAGLAATRKCSLIPDAIRSWGLPELGNSRPDYTAAVETATKAKYPPNMLKKVLVDSSVPVPPFAAIVFLRAGNDRQNISKELRGLREELESVRAALAMFQSEKELGDYRGRFITLFGRPHTEESKNAINDRVNDAITALRKAKLPIPPTVARLRPVFDIVKSSTTLLFNLVQASPQIPKAIEKLISIAKGVNEMNLSGDKTSFLEIHYQLGWELRRWRKHKIDLTKMFGHIQDDERIAGIDSGS